MVREAAIAAAREVMAIAAAYGHPITGQTPEDRIARSSKIAHRPSILQDLDAGRAMEIDALFTVPLQLAREAGVPTPVLDLSVALVTRAAVGGRGCTGWCVTREGWGGKSIPSPNPTLPFCGVGHPPRGGCQTPQK